MMAKISSPASTARAGGVGPTGVHEIPYRDPLAAFAPLAMEPFAQLLHSVPGAAGGGRYSFIVADPFETLVLRGGVLYDGTGELAGGDPFAALRRLLAQYAGPTLPGLPPFQGGAVGFFGYEMGRYVEDVPAPTQGLGFPDMVFGFYDGAAAFDHADKRAWVISRRESWAEALAARLGEADESRWKWPALPAPKSTHDRAAYCQAVRTIIDHIYDGDLYQANFSQRFSLSLPAPEIGFDLFRRLTAVSPVSYAAYQVLPGLTLVSNSPERFVRLTPLGDGWQAETRPIKGTIARTAGAEDRAARTRLAHSAKDRAENIMIVDLLRNDLSKVCRDDSVTITGLCEPESYAGVHHLVSTVIGRLKPGRDALDLIRACFPGGSITGAPKRRAMEIIAELEGCARGPYCGAIGYFGFDGAMDTNIAIRTLIIKTGREAEGCSAYFQVGGGITAQSDPDAEYQESLDKAAAFLRVLSQGDKSGQTDGGRDRTTP